MAKANSVSPYPWTVYRGECDIMPDEVYVAVLDANNEIVCDSRHYYPERLDERNANVIAAAPELLDALLKAIKYADQDDDWVDSATKAANKARGFTEGTRP